MAEKLEIGMGLKNLNIIQFSPKKVTSSSKFSQSPFVLNSLYLQGDKCKLTRSLRKKR